jgi:hypothetical protein
MTYAGPKDRDQGGFLIPLGLTPYIPTSEAPQKVYISHHGFGVEPASQTIFPDHYSRGLTFEFRATISQNISFSV